LNRWNRVAADGAGSFANLAGMKTPSSLNHNVADMFCGLQPTNDLAVTQHATLRLFSDPIPSVMAACGGRRRAVRGTVLVGDRFLFASIQTFATVRA
jgi:hypothetical protein